jgi:dipeptidyl aminopeptidase/acylaminoacyl peptidase
MNYFSGWLRLPGAQRLVIAIATIALLSPVAAGAAVDPEPFTPADLLAVRQVKDPQVSPDGAWVAFVVGTDDLEEDRPSSDLWMVSWDGSRTLQLTYTAKESESHPRWSPDNRFLGFLTARNGENAKSQVWLLDRTGGEARQLTTLPGGVTDFAWSPDGKRLALIASDPDPDEPTPDDACETAKKKTPAPIVIDRYKFKEDVTGYLRHLRDHLYLFDLETASAELLTPGDFDEFSPVWSPDGSRIAFVSKRDGDPDRNENSDVFVIAARAGAVPEQLTHFESADAAPHWGAPAWSPDGGTIAYLQGGPVKYRDYDPPTLAIIRADGGEPRLLATGLDRSATEVTWSADGRALLFLLEDDRSQQLARVPAADGPVERLTEPGAVVWAYSTAAGRTALLLTRPDLPAEVFAMENSGALRQLTDQNRDLLQRVQLGAVEGVSAIAADGNEVHGLLVKPPGFVAGTRYPLVVLIHGGPVGQDGFEFDAMAQAIAGANYLVVQPNYRGSSGRGREYSRVLWGRWGAFEPTDVQAVVDRLIADGLADPKRLGIAGWSYGGMTTNYTIATTDRFAAAVSGAGISNQITGYGTDLYVRQYELEFGKPWEGLDGYLGASYPFFHADRIHTPTLFLCGEKDFNVPLVNSEQMYQALRSLGVETELVIYPGQFHGLTTPSYRKDRVERYIAWFDRFLKATPE